MFCKTGQLEANSPNTLPTEYSVPSHSFENISCIFTYQFWLLLRMPKTIFNEYFVASYIYIYSLYIYIRPENPGDLNNHMLI